MSEHDHEPQEHAGESFRCRLEALLEFPCVYPFKFIVPAERLAEALALFPEGTATQRQSRTGKYISVSADLHMTCADEILIIYHQARAITGVVAL
jgi:putative lipoic acid-binding regulatory protein